MSLFQSIPLVAPKQCPRAEDGESWDLLASDLLLGSWDGHKERVVAMRLNALGALGLPSPLLRFEDGYRTYLVIK